MAERTWTDTQMHAGFVMFSMVHATGRCTGMHPFASLTSFVVCTIELASILDIEGSLQLFHENLCKKMGYDYDKIRKGLDEELCREDES